MAIAGRATTEGTERYRARFNGHPDHFQALQDLKASSIGLGTYLGDPNDAVDEQYAEAAEAALTNGCNLLDTASNYRCQRSERVLGAVLERLIQRGALSRDEVIVCTKGGYIPYDGTPPVDPGRYLIDAFFAPGIVQYDDIVGGCHVLTPKYIEHQLANSLRNLRVETIDVYYLHNPEQQLDEVPRATFISRMESVIQLLEQKARDGAIRWYGTATWNGYRINPQQAGHLSLEELHGIAERVGGREHHFRVVQLPINLAMPEAYAFKNQTVGGKELSLLDAAKQLGTSVVASASILQSQLAKLPGALQQLIPGLRTDAQRPLQFARSAPGVTTALIGMKRKQHVEENLQVAHSPKLSDDQVGRLFEHAERA